MTQPTMFDRLNPAPVPADSFVTEPAEVRRLTGQNAAKHCVCIVCGAAFTVTPRAKGQWCSERCHGASKTGLRRGPIDGYRQMRGLDGRAGAQEHRVVVERVLGRHLDQRHPVHHVDGNKTNNATHNLVVCEDAEYHALLHRRARVVMAGGDPDTQALCSKCRRLKPSNDVVSGSYCRDCRRAYNEAHPVKRTPGQNEARNRKRRVAVIPSDSHVTAPSEMRRLASQCTAILARLQQGPATARELAALSLKYTGRISDLRAAGYDIPPPVEDRASGLSVYTLRQS